jgi:hypothetical protein
MGGAGRYYAMTKDEFYRSKAVVSTEWWLDTGWLPDTLSWARLRVFNDGSADACWAEGDRLYGFDDRQFARYFLSEDEYDRFDTMDAEDELEYGIVVATIEPPSWVDRVDQAFEYLGQY